MSKTLDLIQELWPVMTDDQRKRAQEAAREDPSAELAYTKRELAGLQLRFGELEGLYKAMFNAKQ